MSSQPRILGVDDEARITRVLRTSLSAQLRYSHRLRWMARQI